MVTRSIRIEAPGWLDDVADPSLGPDAPDEKRMAWLLDVLDRQVDEKTGGPFAAAVFSGLTGEVLGVGVNRVEPTSTCVAHAEVLALVLARSEEHTSELPSLMRSSYAVLCLK